MKWKSKSLDKETSSILQYTIVGDLARLQEKRIEEEEREKTIEILASIFQEAYDECIDEV